MAYNLPSQYQPTWDQLKKTGKVRLVADPKHHERIWNALRKRKNRDLGFKLQVAEQFKEAYLTRSSNQNILTITLVYKASLGYPGAY